MIFIIFTRHSRVFMRCSCRTKNLLKKRLRQRRYTVKFFKTVFRRAPPSYGLTDHSDIMCTALTSKVKQMKQMSHNWLFSLHLFNICLCRISIIRFPTFCWNHFISKGSTHAKRSCCMVNNRSSHQRCSMKKDKDLHDRSS